MAAPKKKTRKPKREGTHALKSVLEQIYPSYSPIAWEAVEVFSRWRKIVPPRVARVTRPVRLDGTTLVVHVSESPWIHELQFLKQDLLEQLNSESSLPLKDIVFRLGSLS